MQDPAALDVLLNQHGYAIFLLACVIEGPAVTVVAAALAQDGHFALSVIFALAILGDLLGDVAVHLIGRFAANALPARLRHRLGLQRHVLAPLVQAFGARGGRMLILAKLTHFAGLPVLFASGLARMPFLPFLWFSLLATLPKVALLCALGWSFGLSVSHLAPSSWLAAAAVLPVLAILIHVNRKERRSMP